MDGATTAETRALAPLGTRLRQGMADPAMLANPPVAAIFCLLAAKHLVAPDPYWFYVAVVLGGGAVAISSRAVWGMGVRPWHRDAYVAANMAVIASVAYSTGWGPILSIGFLFGAAGAFHIYGSRAMWPALVWTTVCMALAQTAIALRIAPTFIPLHLVQGVAGLSLTGALLVIALLGRAASTSERVEGELRQSEGRFKALVSNASDIIVVTDMRGLVQYVSPAFERRLGRSAEPYRSRSLGSLLHPDDRARIEEEFPAIFSDPDGVLAIELRLPHADGSWRDFEASVTNRLDDADVGGLVTNLHDVTEQRQMSRHLEHAAIHDPLTGLPNRVLFMDRLTMALTRAARAERKAAVAFLDLDRFKLVNDGLGHAAGDDLLVAVANRLRQPLRSGDTVARFGGDEFTILFEDLGSLEEALAVTRRMLAQLQRPFELAAGPVFVSASIGLVISDEDSASSSMLRDADTAMYMAKEGGRGRIEVFDAKSHLVALESLNVMNELHSALRLSQFRLHYQPIVDVASEDVVAVEGLIRWMHPTRGLVGPLHFIDLAEDSGLIVPIGEWVLRAACAQGARWEAIALEAGARPVEVHVNVSPRQLANADFPRTVAAALDDSGLSPDLLCLEITERTLTRDEEATAEAFRRLRALDVRISVDDFGTGYSSLSYLKRFPIDSLKVDRSFVAGLGEDPENSAIVEAVIALAHSLRLDVVAEGVETAVALDELRRLDCGRAQGYLFGAPVPAEQLDDVLFAAALRDTA